MSGLPPASSGPGSAHEALARAAAWERAGRVAEAEETCRDVLRNHGEHPEALQMLAAMAHRKGDTPAAIVLLERAVAANGGDPRVHSALCGFYRAEGRLDEAVAAGRRAVALATSSAGAYHQLGVALADRLELDEAAACFLRAITLDPGLAAAHLELAQLLLKRGHFRPGWLEYEWRYKLEHASNLLPKFREPQWNGMQLPKGRILLIGDQGYGDTIQFSRYIPQVAGRCSEVLLGCSQELLPLLAAVPGVGRSFVQWQDIPRFDVHCPMSSLPGVFGTELDTIPAEVPYLKSDPGKVGRWRERLKAALPAGHLRVGIIWASRPRHPLYSRKSVGLGDLAPVFRLSNVAFVSLQKDVPAAGAASASEWSTVIDLSSGLTDFGETAAAIEALDLVISVDTAVAHLAGALGRPVWALLPRVSDWRWMLDREDSPWYPTMRLFRQRVAGQWKEVLGRVVDELKAVMGGAQERLMPHARAKQMAGGGAAG